MAERIINPKRYNRNGISVWDIEKTYDPFPHLTGFETHLRNTMLEYLLRFPEKNGIEDLRKIEVNLTKLLDTLACRKFTPLSRGSVFLLESSLNSLPMKRIEEAFAEPSLTKKEMVMRNAVLYRLLNFHKEKGEWDLRAAEVDLVELESLLKRRNYKSSRQQNQSPAEQSKGKSLQDSLSSKGEGTSGKNKKASKKEKSQMTMKKKPVKVVTKKTEAKKPAVKKAEAKKPASKKSPCGCCCAKKSVTKTTKVVKKTSKK